FWRPLGNGRQRRRRVGGRLMDTKWLRNSLVYLIILVAVIALFITVSSGASEKEGTAVPMNEVAAGVREGTIRKITVTEDKLSFEKTDGKRYTARKEHNATVSQVLKDYGVSADQLDRVNIVLNDPPQFTNWLGLLVNLLPLVFFGAVLLFMMRQAQGSNNQALSFGKSRARMFM